MQIQVNTDNHTRNSAKWTQDVQALIGDRLSRYADRITRAEIHLTDENSAAKAGGNDKRCMIEVRMAGFQPISVTDRADSHDDALDGAVTKMLSLLETTIGKHESR